LTVKPERDPRQVNLYLKYSGMALQLFVLLGVGAWLGQWLDKKLATPQPYFTIILILLFMGGFFYRLVKDLSRKDET
jgi:F0F1-type ATP synthase assembly protein I